MIQNSKFNIKNSQGGFTLLEILIYAVILAVFIGAAFSFLSSILGTTDNLLERNEVLANQEFVERKFYWILSAATNVSAPATNGSGTVLTAQGVNPAIYPATFNLNNGQINLALVGGAVLPITNGRVSATQFLVQNFSNSQTSSTMSLSLTLSDVVFPYIQSSTTVYYVFPPN